MNTVAEKKRILSMPTVNGELLIKDKKRPSRRGFNYNFSCGYAKHKPGVSNVMIRKANLENIFLECKNQFVELWVPGVCGSEDGYLRQRIPYSDIHILWCTYQGEERTPVPS